MKSLRDERHRGEIPTIRRKIPLFLFLLLAGSSSQISGALEEVTLTVEGMSCTLCARGLQESIQRSTRARSVEADLETGRVHITAESGRPLDLQQIRSRIVRSGFTPVREVMIRATGAINEDARGKLTFQIPGNEEDYVLLEGAELRQLLISLPASGSAWVTLTGRIHRHPEDLPPSFSVLRYEVRTP